MYLRQDKNRVFQNGGGGRIHVVLKKSGVTMDSPERCKTTK